MQLHFLLYETEVNQKFKFEANDNNNNLGNKTNKPSKRTNIQQQNTANI